MSCPVAFYAPLKPPDHPNPSGDRLLARLLMQALGEAGFEVRLACRLRSRDPVGDGRRQQRLARLGERLAERLVHRWRRQGWNPKLWFTYHLYYKAPDWIGPAVCRRLGIPYVVAEASWATRRAQGAWAPSHHAVTAALQLASRIFTFNPSDEEGLRACLGVSAPIVELPPFLDTDALGGPPVDRQSVGQRWRLDPALPWLVCVAMMRPGDKLDSYRLLAEAMRHVRTPCRLLLVGDGSARSEVEAAFAGDARSRFLGKLAPDRLMPLLGACDLMVWPAVNEAFGMALLEAQACRLPVIAGNERGVSAVVHDGLTGRLIEPRDPVSLARAIDESLADPQQLRRWRDACHTLVERKHSLQAAARTLRMELEPLIDA